MRDIQMMAIVLLGAATLLATRPAQAGSFNSASECKVGARVVSNEGYKGTITRVDKAWSYCYVRQDETGKEVGYLYSLLRPEGAGVRPGASAASAAKPAAAAGGGRPVIGKYMCWVGSEASASGLSITGASSYESDGQAGKFHVEASGRVVFESGPFMGFNAKMLENGRIGMNLTGGTFYNLTCDPPH